MGWRPVVMGAQVLGFMWLYVGGLYLCAVVLWRPALPAVGYGVLAAYIISLLTYLLYTRVLRVVWWGLADVWKLLRSWRGRFMLSAGVGVFLVLLFRVAPHINSRYGMRAVLMLTWLAVSNYYLGRWWNATYGRARHRVPEAGSEP